MNCPHEFRENIAAVSTDGLCPLCLAADVNRLMIGIGEAITLLESKHPHSALMTLRELLVPPHDF
jgi:hypothetical protein